MSRDEYLAAGNKAREASFRLWRIADEELDKLLRKRIRSYEWRRFRSLLVAGVALLAAIGFVSFITRSISGPLRKQALELHQANTVMRAEIQERERAEQALRRSEASHRAVLEAVITIDKEGRTEFNPAAEQVFGYQRKDALGCILSELIVPPGLRQAHNEGLQRYLETGQGRVLGRRIEVPAMRADQSQFPAELAIVRSR